METYLIAAFFVFVGLAYIIFGKISSVAYAARPFDPESPPRSPARYFWKVYRELHPESFLPQACAACVIIALMILLAALLILMH
ncbi:MAG: hypothetical protein LAN64_06110 [Acidobacteriia bacterium]|nr:hypothetical protein [Terriglobia bacterium]